MYLGWCDFRKLAEKYIIKHFAGSDYALDKILYFTAPVPRKLESTFGETDRQALWIKGISQIEGLTPFLGVHTPSDKNLRQEKMTDVNIALQLVLGSVNDSYDAAILLCNDNDQAPAVEAVIGGKAG